SARREYRTRHFFPSSVWYSIFPSVSATVPIMILPCGVTVGGCRALKYSAGDSAGGLELLLQPALNARTTASANSNGRFPLLICFLRLDRRVPRPDGPPSAAQTVPATSADPSAAGGPLARTP